MSNSFIDGLFEAYDTRLVGENGKGHLWSDETSDADDEINKNMQVASLTHDISNILISDSSASVVSDGSSFEESDSDELSAQEIFQKEVVQTLERAFSDGHTVEIALLELNTLRLASNVTFHDLLVVVIPTVLSRIDKKRLMHSTKEILGRWGPLIGKMIHSKRDQVDTIQILQEHCAETQADFKIFAPACRILYEMDIFEEEAILKWYYSDLSKRDTLKPVRDQIR
ncbi:6184_t:CDS:2 [Acaulospora morrowiae]|uniref:6184_t:CDS:1 n=1 Tax=Acaulospora morrowiae TaxID=94023 RepID=A0A9N8V9U3_9GLOM|nr:6184_t:CDS:2 [Acaulospora morrowiae]